MTEVSEEQAAVDLLVTALGVSEVRARRIYAQEKAKQVLPGSILAAWVGQETLQRLRESGVLGDEAPA